GRVRMNATLPEIDADGITAVFALQLGDPCSRLFQRRFPGNGTERIAFPALRLADPVGVVLHVEDGSRLRADVAAAEGIVRIAPHRARLDVDREAAHGFAQHAGMESLCHGDVPGGGPYHARFRAMLESRAAKNRYLAGN